MEGRVRILFLNSLCLLTLGLLAGNSVLAAETAPADKGASQQQVIQPEIERRKIDVDKIDTEDFEVGIYTGLLSVEDFGANVVIGARAAYHVTEGVFFEAAYAKSDTSETSYEPLGYNLFPGETFIGKNWAFNSALYVIGGVGNTSFAGDDRFTVNFGAGYRFLATDWLAFHFDVRDHIFDIDLLGNTKTAHNLETHGGITVFF
jgi:hypothetical protein